jgi:cation diffusion facilitator CzcD-associated flavoprotein CzcO
MAIKLEEAGTPFTVFEKSAEVGGTWRDNTYPGLVCDVPAAVYTYSFERNPDWVKRKGSPGTSSRSPVSGPVVVSAFGARS